MRENKDLNGVPAPTPITNAEHAVVPLPLSAITPAAHTTFDLTAEESLALQNINMQALNAKARIYDLQVELEAARGQLSAAQAAWVGAIGSLASTRQLKGNVSISPDFKRIQGV